MKRIIYVGMDVHLNSYTMCCVEPSFKDEDKIFGHMRLEPSVSSVKLYLTKIAERINDPGRSIHFICGYEAGFIGYSLYHEMNAAGLTCVILAPSTMPQHPGHRIKTDKRDAEHIAKSLAYGTYRAVHIPTAEDEQTLSDLSTSMAWLGILAYTLQIYFDFSGYSDMAIGLGKMFGFHFKENFDYPYLSQSIREFWRRWHISLGSWFRDYVYIPLGGSKRGNMRTALNLIVVWFMTGLWHGANLTFVVWGIYYCVLILIERYILKEGRNNDRSKLVRRSIVFLLVVIGWVFFRSPNLTSAGGYLRIMFAIVPNQLMDRQFILYSREYFLFLVVGFILAGGAVPAFRKQLNKYPKVEYVFTVLLSCAGLLLSIAYLTKGGYNPFIYFNF
jgi:hypothetical protein